MLSDDIQHIFHLDEMEFFFKHLSLFHNFCLETDKTVQKAQNSSKAESEPCR